jgi:hypothetical protein
VEKLLKDNHASGPISWGENSVFALMTKAVIKKDKK